MNILGLLLIQIQIIGGVGADWPGLLDPIGELIFGDGLDTEGIIGDNEMIAGLFLFLILFAFTIIMGLGMLIGSVVIIPSLFAVFQYIPSLQIIVAIICGLLFGFALNKIIRR